MGAGVDPTQMCRRLVDKVGRWEQLFAVADPNLLVLFEDWLEALEEEVVTLVKGGGQCRSGPGISKAGTLPGRGRFFAHQVEAGRQTDLIREQSAVSGELKILFDWFLNSSF